MRDLIWFGACCALAGAALAAYAVTALASGQQAAPWQVITEAAGAIAWAGGAIWYARAARRSR